MTELLIFTLLATIVALYTVLSEHRKIRVNFIIRRRRWTLWIIFLLIAIVSIYIIDQYIQITNSDPRIVYDHIPKHPERVEFTSRFPLFLTQIFTSIILVLSLSVVFFTTFPEKGNKNYFTSKIRELYNREQYGVLVDVISENYSLLLYKGSTSIPTASSRTRDYLLDPHFSGVHPNIAPELGIRIIEDNNIEKSFKKDFTREFLKTQVQTENSLLRREIPENQYLEDRWKYAIQDENELLAALLIDISRAEDLVVYNAAGSAANDVLREHRHIENDPYHEPRLSPHKGADYYAYNDPIFTTIRFIDLVMVRAIEKDSDYPMGLTEIMSLTRNICQNFDITSASDPSAEWPNDYAFFLYHIFQALVDWVRVVEYEYENKSDYSIELNEIREDWTGSATSSAVVCLFKCHREVLTCSNIPDDYKDYISMMVFREWLSLREFDITELPYWYSKQMGHCLEQNIGTATKSREYRDEMRAVFQRQKTEIRIEDRQMTGLVSELNSILY